MSIIKAKTATIVDLFLRIKKCVVDFLQQNE